MRDNATGKSLFDELSRIADGLFDGSMDFRSAGPQSRRAIAEAVTLFAASRISRAEMNAVDLAGECRHEGIEEGATRQAREERGLNDRPSGQSREAGNAAAVNSRAP